MTEIIKPLDRKSALADTPADQIQFSVPLKLASGHTVQAPDPQATRALVALMDMGAVIGGAASHWGGPSAFAELMSSLHAIMFHEARSEKKSWHDLFNFVNDGGHCENGLYALKANCGFAGMKLDDLKHFRSIQSKLTGHGESHLFPEGVMMSNGPLGSAFPQAQGLAFADAMSGNKRVTITAITDGACMEGEAREAMAAVPGLAANGKMAPFVLIISDNNTKLTGRIDKDSYSMTPTFASLNTLGWDVLDLHEGQNLKACADAIQLALNKVRENPRRPVAIHARTIKGFGVKKTADSASGGHGFPLKHPSELKAFLTEIYTGREVPTLFLKWAEELEAQVATKKSGGGEKPAVPEMKVQVGVSKALIAKVKEGLPVISISADLPGSTGMADFQKAFPQNTQDIGVAESNMVSMAAGASKLGYIPVVDTFAQFGVTKGSLPLTMASLSQSPILAVFSHVGFQDAADGASHQALCYFAMLGAIPHVKLYNLTCSDEAEALVGQAVDEFAQLTKQGKTPDSSIFFLGRENFPAHYGVTQFKLGTAQVVRDAAQPSLVIAAGGALLGQALEAAKTLASQGIEAVVINPSIINRPDVKTFKTYLEKCGGKLLTVEDHQLIGGMGSMLTHALLQEGVQLKSKSLGVQGEFGQSAYEALELYQKHGLDAAAIAAAANQLIR